MKLLDRNRPASVVALLATAVFTGGLAGVVVAAFIWTVNTAVRLLWSDLPEWVGVDPFDSWWLFAVPIIGGVLVGLGHHLFGNHPRPIEEAIATWKQGGRLDPAVAPKTAVNSLVILAFGGPVGFEAALIGLLGGTGTWICDRIAGVGSLVRQVWGAERVDSLPSTVHHLPYWLAALAGLFTYRWLPFGGIDMGFRFNDFDGRLGVGDGLIVFVVAALLVVPATWAIALIARAEQVTLFERSPILVGMAGGAVFALLAVPNSLVLFSGQQGFQLLPDIPDGELLYVSFVKLLALVVALVAGWRGGPVFPTYTAFAAFAVLLDQAFVEIGSDLMMIAALAAVGIVFLKGSIPMAFILTLYPVPLSYASVILVGCAGAAVVLAVARAAGVLPAPPDAPRTETTVRQATT